MRLLVLALCQHNIGDEANYHLPFLISAGIAVAGCQPSPSQSKCNAQASPNSMTNHARLIPQKRVCFATVEQEPRGGRRDHTYSGQSKSLCKEIRTWKQECGTLWCSVLDCLE
eukprot:5984414-Amphidinium_carterae.2